MNLFRVGTHAKRLECTFSVNGSIVVESVLLAVTRVSTLLGDKQLTNATASQYCGQVNVTKLAEVDYRAKLYSVDRLTTNRRLDLTLFF
jgi:spore coat polysaccharide biosynthesis predicted glycosyltransferase SpsG